MKDEYIKPCRATFEYEAPHVGLDDDTGRQIEVVFSPVHYKWIEKSSTHAVCFCALCQSQRRNSGEREPGRGNIYYGNNF